MVSKLATEDVEQLREAGLEVPVADIIRLNALGLRLERNPTSAEWFNTPRAAILGDAIFRQPTIGHELWMANVRKIVEHDEESTIALELYAYTRPAESLVDPYDRAAVSREVTKALEGLRAYTSEQLKAALDYVVLGNRAEDCEFAPQGKMDENAKELIAAADTVAAGYMHDAVAMRLGVSVADVMRMTLSEIHAIITQAKIEQGVRAGGDVANRLRGEYYRLLDDVTARANARKLEAAKNG